MLFKKVNLIGSFNMLRIVAQQMSKQQPYTKDGERGVIVNVASVAACKILSKIFLIF